MGIFGSDHESAGVGIPKNAPKKKGIFRFFELFIRKFWKLAQVNLLYSVFWLPLVLALYAFFKVSNQTVSLMMIVFCTLVFAVVIGPATAGITKILRNYTLEKHSFILTDFKDTFSKNFKNSMAIGLIDILVALSIGAAVNVYPQLAKTYGMGVMLMFVVSVSIGLVVLMMNFYAFLMIVATDLSFKNIVKNSLAFACIALKKNLLTLLIVAIIVALFVVLYLINMSTIFILPFAPAAIIGFIICFNCYPVIQKYVINPYYEQKGMKNPELEEDTPSENQDDVLFEDKGGSEKPIEKRKNKKNSKKGKIIS